MSGLNSFKNSGARALQITSPRLPLNPVGSSMGYQSSPFWIVFELCKYKFNKGYKAAAIVRVGCLRYALKLCTTHSAHVLHYCWAGNRKHVCKECPSINCLLGLVQYNGSFGQLQQTHRTSRFRQMFMSSE